MLVQAVKPLKKDATRRKMTGKTQQIIRTPP